MTHISCGESKPAFMRTMLNGGGKGANWWFKPEYAVDVAEGMDMALMSCPLILIDEEGSDLKNVYPANGYYTLQSLSLSWPTSFSQAGTLHPLRNELSYRCERPSVRIRKSDAKRSISLFNWKVIVTITTRPSRRNLYTTSKFQYRES